MKRRYFVALIATFAVVLGGCGGADPKTTGGAKADIATKVGVYQGAWVSITDFVALDQGIFKKHGLDVTLVPQASGVQGTQLLAAGSIDIAAQPPSNVMIANSNGTDQVVVANIIKGPIYAWVVRNGWPTPHASSGYPESVKDLKGARFGITARGGETELITNAMLKEVGLRPSDVTYVTIGAGLTTAIAAFKTGQVDALVQVDPAVTMLTDQYQGKTVIDLRKGEGPKDLSTASGQLRTGSLKTVDKNPEMYKRYLEATTEAIKFVQDPSNIDKAVDALAKGGMDRTLAKKVVEANRANLSPDYSCAGHDGIGRFQVDAGNIASSKVPTCKKFVWSGAQQYLVN